MTNEEASKILDDYDINFDGHSAEAIAEAFDVAFGALEQEPKTGEWIDESNGYCFNEKCSICGYIVHEQFISEYNYCPHCGAKMESEDKE